MPFQSQLITENILKQVCALNLMDLATAGPKVTTLQASNWYRYLREIEYTNMLPEELICFTLMHKSIDSNMIKPLTLSKHIKNLDFFELPISAEDKHDLKNCLSTILSMVNYSNAICNNFTDYRYNTRAESKYLNLTNLRLSCINLSWQILSNVDLRDSYLKDANLTGIILSNANLSNANLSDCNLNGADLSGAKFESAIINGQIYTENLKLLPYDVDQTNLVMCIDFLHPQIEAHPKLRIPLAKNIIEFIAGLEVSLEIKLNLLDKVISHPLFSTNVNTLTWLSSNIHFFSNAQNNTITNLKEDAYKILTDYRATLRLKLYTPEFISDIKKYFSTNQARQKTTQHSEEDQLLKNKMNDLHHFLHLHGSCYEILKVDQTASDEEIKKSYKYLIKKYHPDKNKETTEQFTSIQYAKEVLMDRTLREFHDDLLCKSRLSL